MTAQPDELDAHARTLEAERNRPMVRWTPGPTPAPSWPPSTEQPATTKTAELIEDVEHLAGTDQPESIARRLGYSTGKNLARRLRRAGRSDLAGLFERRAAS